MLANASSCFASVPLGVSLILRQSSLHSTHYPHFLFTLVFIFLALVSSTEERHICKPPFWGSFSCKLFCQVARSWETTCCLRRGCWRIKQWFEGCNGEKIGVDGIFWRSVFLLGGMRPLRMREYFFLAWGASQRKVEVYFFLGCQKRA